VNQSIAALLSDTLKKAACAFSVIDQRITCEASAADGVIPFRASSDEQNSNFYDAGY
jgi:hypothetical protein